MATGKLQVNSENILPIIKKWLYSDKDIFVRELVSNSIDAIRKVKILRDQGTSDATDESFRIDVKVDKEAKTLTFTDTGLGMSADEVEKYIAQVAFSSAEEFMSHYKSEDEKDQMIGHFGLGFYSAYMVADTVEIQSRSYRSDDTPVHWKCDGSTEYDIGEGTRTERGTEITLHVSEEEIEFLDDFRIREILSRYCTFLPYPVYLNDSLINEHEPLWIKSPSDCVDKDYLDFYKHLYPGEPDPLFWIHLNVDYPFHLQGILYFPKVLRGPTADRRLIQLYCNRVFVSEGCEEVVPDFLLGLRGVIDSPDIPLNVSRSALQMDRTVKQLSGHISKKVADRFTTLYTTDKEEYERCWADIQVIAKLGAMQDDKFYDRIKDVILFQNTASEWTTVEQYIERKEKKVFYTSEGKGQSQFLKMYEDQGVEVLVADSPIDSFMISFLERKLEGVTFQRIDGAIDDSILDASKEKTLLDADGRTEGSHIAEFFKGALDVEVEAKSLTGNIPGFVVMDEQQRRMRDTILASDPNGAMANLAGLTKRTLVVNTNSKLISTVGEMRIKRPELAKAMAQQVYDLALLSQREMAPDQLNAFVSRSSEVLEQLAAEGQGAQ
jgi:molecular chaperone HtpG